jgi:probable rRNA maturation factor
MANKTGTKLPRLPFAEIKNDILGRDYSLSIAFVGKKESGAINKKYRGKDKPTNILSFSMRRNEGEMVLCPQVIKKEASGFGKTFAGFLGFLVIHGMLHLEGMRHGSKMEEAERKYDQKYFHRNRHRILRDASRGRRVFKRRKKS